MHLRIGDLNEIYREGCEVGYRYYDKHKIPVRFRFGFGLSYTTFEASEWKQEGSTYTQTITNIGDRFGAEVAQLYIDGELKGFEKVYLEPGQSKTVTLTVEEEKTDYPDEYTIPEDLPSFPITIESRLTDLRQTFMGRVIYRAMLSESRKAMRKAKKRPAGSRRDNAIKNAIFLERMMENASLRFVSMSAGSRLPYNVACGLAELSNRHLCRGIKCMLQKIKVPKLPKEETKQ